MHRLLTTPIHLLMWQSLAFYRFKKGDYVRCKTEDAAVRYRKPHLRTPGYLFGVVGIVDMVRALQQLQLGRLASAQTPSSSSGCGICFAACFDYMVARQC